MWWAEDKTSWRELTLSFERHLAESRRGATNSEENVEGSNEFEKIVNTRGCCSKF